MHFLIGSDIYLKIMGEHIGLVSPAEGFVQTPRFNFGRYSECRGYNKVNGDLVAEVLERLPQKTIVALDVAMGHGMVPRLISTQLADTNRQAHVIGVDLDAYAVQQARTQILDTANTYFTFLQGDARDLRHLLEGHVKPGGINYTSIHDAIHEIRDDGIKAAIVRSQAEILAPEGLLSYNSAFTTIAVGREWAIWVIEFMKRFDGAHKYKGDDVQGLPILAPAFYRGLIEDAGLSIVHESIVEVPHFKEDLEAIAEYPPFAKGFTEKIVFPRKVELEEGITIMKQAIPPTLKKLKRESLTRKWHEIIAQKLLK